jgi:hypothetical protein
VYCYDRICACFFNQFQTFHRFCRFASQPTDTWYVVILNNSGTYWKVSVTTVLFSEYCFNSKLFSPRANWFLSALPLEASAYICTRQLEKFPRNRFRFVHCKKDWQELTCVYCKQQKTKCLYRLDNSGKNFYLV